MYFIIFNTKTQAILQFFFLIMFFMTNQNQTTLTVEYEALRAFQEDVKRNLKSIEKSQKHSKEIYKILDHLNRSVSKLDNLITVNQEV